MSVNAIPISRTTLPTDGLITANGSYTLPRHAYIPNASIQPFNSPGGQVPGPQTPGISANFAVVPRGPSKPYPAPTVVYGIRAQQIKSSPAG